MTTFTETITLVKIECGRCAATYAISERYRADRERDGGCWHCPYCQCDWGYSNDYENARLRKQIEAKERELREAKCETLRERLLRDAAKAEAAKAQRKVERARNGTCTICNRSFSALRRHMAAKHPESTRVKAHKEP